MERTTKLQLNSGRCVEAIEQRLPVALYFGRWKPRHDHQCVRSPLNARRTAGAKQQHHGKKPQAKRQRSAPQTSQLGNLLVGEAFANAQHVAPGGEESPDAGGIEMAPLPSRRKVTALSRSQASCRRA